MVTNDQEPSFLARAMQFAKRQEDASAPGENSAGPAKDAGQEPAEDVAAEGTGDTGKAPDEVPAQVSSGGEAANADACAEPDEPGEPGEPARLGEPVGPEGFSLKEYLIFLLGLVPVAIAVMRVVLMAQGDTATLYTLIRTLDVQGLIIGTYGRYVGVLGAGTALTVLAFHFRRVRDNEPGLKSVGLAVAVIGLLISVACIYPEEIADTSVRSLRPVDILRASFWACVLYWLVRLAPRWLDRLAQVRWPAGLKWLARLVEWLRPVAGAGRRAKQIGRRPAETIIMIATVVLLVWPYLLTNERVWIPAEVITVSRPSRSIAEELPPISKSSRLSSRDGILNSDLSSFTLRHRRREFTGYVLDENLTDLTIMTAVGRLVILPIDDVVTRSPCQFESDFDPGIRVPARSVICLAGRVADSCSCWSFGACRGGCGGDGRSGAAGLSRSGHGDGFWLAAPGAW